MSPPLQPLGVIEEEKAPPLEMDEAYWDSVAVDYREKVLSVFDEDREGVVCQEIGDAVARAGKNASAADLGCGVGNFSPLLASGFSRVEACDFSADHLEMARGRCSQFSNINFSKIDFTIDSAPFDPVDFALCVNVLIMPSLDERLRAWRFVVNQVAADGTLVLVVPSLESAHFQDFQSVDKQLADGSSCEDAIKTEIPDCGTVSEMHLGVRPADRMPTKHYLREELEFMLSDAGFETVSIQKVEYNGPDDESKHDPRPWDWMAVACRRGSK